uniref:Aldo-keto reductase family 1 member C1 homolog isoform X2 n=1 Tax=Geotrypetes seraphini TaxID=260995 RepID=A0A6P8RRH5_GEOSA|nr:aldo-keto reductase family 1 member C1 homolog isoform X2 [Geotrypetes seraphini]
MALSKDSCITMNDGNKIPVIALGTFSGTLPITSADVTEKILKEQVGEATKLAINIGYRHIDGAFLYSNEQIIGPAIQAKIADGTVKREDLFYTGKLWCTFHKPDLVEPILRRTLKALRMNYINLYIIHLPVSLKFGDNLTPVNEKGEFIFEKTDLCAVWEVECHPYLNQKKLLEFCKKNDIVLVAYGVLGSINVNTDWQNHSIPPVLHDPAIAKIAQKYHKSPAQVSIRYTIQRGIVVIAKSFTHNHIEDNFKVFDFQLTEDDMKQIDGLNKNLRYWNFEQFSKHPQYPFHDEY